MRERGLAFLYGLDVRIEDDILVYVRFVLERDLDEDSGRLLRLLLVAGQSERRRNEKTNTKIPHRLLDLQFLHQTIVSPATELLIDTIGSPVDKTQKDSDTRKQ